MDRDNEGLSLPAAQLPEISAKAGGHANPYRTPASSWAPPLPAMPGEAPEEIANGSVPINAGACVKRGFDLTVRNFGMLLLVGVIYFAVMTAVEPSDLGGRYATGRGMCPSRIWKECSARP